MSSTSPIAVVTSASRNIRGNTRTIFGLGCPAGLGEAGAYTVEGIASPSTEPLLIKSRAVKQASYLILVPKHLLIQKVSQQ